MIAAAAAAVAGCDARGGTPVLVGGATGRALAAHQVLHLGNGTEIQSLDPHRSEDVSGSNVLRDLYEGLVNEAPNADPEPGAAESWTVSEDGKTYVFALRRNARWSNGDLVTAHDFVYGFRRAADPKTLSIYTFILSPIENADAIGAGRLPPDRIGVRALDDYTLEIRLANATPYFLGLLSHSMTYPVHRASVEKYGAKFTRPGHLVGNGAVRLEAWVVQSHIKLVRIRITGTTRTRCCKRSISIRPRTRPRSCSVIARTISTTRMTSRLGSSAGSGSRSRRSSSSRRISAATTTGST